MAWVVATVVGALALNVVLDVTTDLSLLARYGIVLAALVAAGAAFGAWRGRRERERSAGPDGG